MRLEIVNLTNLASSLAIVLMAGCAGTPRPATQIVKVPTFVPCVQDRPVRPTYQFDKLAATASDGEKIIALAQDWPKGRKYESELEAAFAACLDLRATELM